MTKEQRNVIKHQKLRVKALGETITGIRQALDATSGELHQTAFGRMEEDPDEVSDLDEAAILLFHVCQEMEQARGYLERAAGVKK